MKDKPEFLCRMFLFSFLALTAHSSCLLRTEELTNRNVLVA